MKPVTGFILFLSLVWLTGAGAAGLPSAPPFAADQDLAVARTASGKVRGYIHKGTYIYKGIPYARAERFMPPEKPEAWERIRSTMAWGPVCPPPCWTDPPGLTKRNLCSSTTGGMKMKTARC